MNDTLQTESPFAPALAYAESGLDRVSDRRQNADWVDEQLQRATGRFLVTWRYRHAVHYDDAPELHLVGRDAVNGLLERSHEPILLGLDGAGEPVFALDLDLEEESEAREACEADLADLRRIGPLLPARQAAMAALARGLIYWHRHHGFCGRCGAPTRSRYGGYMRRCTNESCNKQHFPRMDPAVIMLVDFKPDDGEPVCLLGQGPKWPAGSFSTLAGFMEPGESLEETVAREVMEEAGVPVDQVRYRGSQPWPFPSSLMLGFRARALSRELRLDPHELADAGWFTAAELRDFGEWTDPDAALRLPRRDSIARFLIDEWIAEVDP